MKISQLISCNVFPANNPQSITVISSLCIIRYIQIQNNFSLLICSYPSSFNLLSGIFGDGSTQALSLRLVLQHTLESEQSLSFLHELGIFCAWPDLKLDTEGQSLSLPGEINIRNNIVKK